MRRMNGVSRHRFTVPPYPSTTYADPTASVVGWNRRPGEHEASASMLTPHRAVAERGPGPVPL